MAVLALLLRHGPHRRAHANGLPHLRAHADGLPHLRALSTTTAAGTDPGVLSVSAAKGTTAAGTDPGVLSVSTAKRRLRLDHDPDRTVSILGAIDTASISAGATRHTLSVAARRLTRAGRAADAEALLSSHLPAPASAATTTEPRRLAAVLSSYASANLPEKALAAFRSAAPSLAAPVSPLPFNALLSTFLGCRRHGRVPALFAELSEEFSITPDATSYSILVRAYCMNRDDAKAKKTLDQMRQQGISPTTRMYTSLIHSMYKQKKTVGAEILWKEMVESGCKPDIATYNVKVMNYRVNGKLEEVMEVMAEMEAAGVKPDIITYNFLMNRYCRSGKLEDAMALYRSLDEKGCSANVATYGQMLTALCAKGDFDAGLGIFKESLKRNKVPNFRTMKGLVEGLVKGGRVAEAKKVIAEVKKKFPDNLLYEWKKFEKELRLEDSVSGNTPHSKGTSRQERVAEAKPVAADTRALELELEASATDKTDGSEEPSEDEACVP